MRLDFDCERNRFPLVVRIDEAPLLYSLPSRHYFSCAWLHATLTLV